MAITFAPLIPAKRQRARFRCAAMSVSLGIVTVSCGENTDKVIFQVPTTLTAASGGNAAGGASSSIVSTGGVNTGGVVSIGGASSGGTGNGGSSTTSTGPLMSAAGAPIGYAAVAGNNLQTTTGGGSASPDYASSCDDLQTLLGTDDTPRVVVINSKEINCTLLPPALVTVPTCPLTCDSTTGDTKTIYRVLGSASDCSAFNIPASTPTVDKTRNERVINVRSNKTLLGVGSNPTITGATLYLNSTVSNVIVQNLNLQKVNPDIVEAGDAITIDGANHVWVDHCNFSLISDGFIDAPSSSSNVSATNITISWNHFDGNNPSACAKQHNYANTIENATITFHHNFYDHTLGCSPKISQPMAKVHLFNNYWLSVLYYSIGVDKGAQALIEHNDFNDSLRPYWGMNTCLSKINCAISDSSGSNQFELSSTGTGENKDTGGTLVNLPPYIIDPIKLEDSKVVAAEVSNPTTGAGATLPL